MSSTLPLDPRTYSRALACVHCGLCLPACPTYTETGHEADSPRGRIQLMRGLADGVIQPTDSVKHHLDLCLDCRGCETACPSGVIYHELIEETRARFAEQSSRPLDMQSRLLRWMYFNVFVHPTRLKLALLPLRILQKLGIYTLLVRSGILNLLPSRLRKLTQMLPPNGKLWPRLLPERAIASGTGFQPVLNELTGAKPKTKPKIVFFTTCIGSVVYNQVNRQAVELLAATGADVLTPRLQVCCGAIHHHNGAHRPAQAFAKRNIDVFESLQADFITTTIAGCGAMLREYDHLLRDDPGYAQRARAFSSRVRDATEVLIELGLPPMQHAVNDTITYHDACHLAHAQKVTAPPRKLLSSIPGLKLIPLPESDMCCGAAGTYNLEHPEMASTLAERKLANIAATGCTTCAAANVGCAMHLASEAASRNRALHIVHPVELLHVAVFGR